MPGSIRIARIAGIDVYIHLTFLLVLAYFGFYGYRAYGQEGMVFSLLAILFLFACVLLHEFGHAFAARYYGIGTPDITLLPIGGVARIERMPEEPRQEIVIAIAGPMVNVVIAILLGAALFLSGGFDPGLFQLVLTWQIHRFPDMTTAIMHLLFLNNIVLVLFNMIPAFPMDGGRVVRAMLAMTMPIERATFMAAGLGKIIAVMFGFIGLFGNPFMGHVGLFWNPMLILLAVFLFIAAQREAEAMEVQALTKGMTIREVMITNFKMLPHHATMHEAVDYLLSSYQPDFPVVDAEGGLLGMLTKRKMLTTIRQHGELRTPVRNVMRDDIKAVTLNDRLKEVLERMNTLDVSAIPVADQFGRVIGLVTPENVEEMMIVKEAIKARQKRDAAATA